MRDIIVTLMVMGTLPFILRNAYFGVLVWSWLSYMNPHRLTWGFALSIPFAQIVAIVLLFSLVMSRESKAIPSNSLVVLWFVFMAWMAVCTVFAIYPDFAMESLITIFKIQLITLVTMMLMKSLQRINMLIWVIVFSIGFYSVKGGAFTLMTGGSFHVFGPQGSFIEENNTLGVAILMILPMMLYLYRFPPHRWVKRIMPICILLSMASVVGSQSRGALLAVLTVGGYFWLKSRSKMLTTVLFLILAVFGYQFMPESWHERMATTVNYEEDESATSRLKAWEYSINVASQRLTGGGFNSWSKENYAIYGPPVEKAFVAHSIYFGVLGDTGWPGLVLFVLALSLIWLQLGRVAKITEGNEERADINFLARMLKVSMLAFMSGGAFLSLAYFDLTWHIMAITVALVQLTRHDVAKDRHTLSRQQLPRPAVASGGRGAGRAKHI